MPSGVSGYKQKCKYSFANEQTGIILSRLDTAEGAAKKIYLKIPRQVFSLGIVDSSQYIMLYP